MRISVHIWGRELLLQIRRRDNVPSVVVVPPELFTHVSEVLKVF